MENNSCTPSGDCPRDRVGASRYGGQGRNRAADAIVAKVRLVREGGNFGGATRDQTDDLIVAKGTSPSSSPLIHCIMKELAQMG